MDIKTDSNRNSVLERPLIFIDLEMTGLSVQKHEIIEIGALKVEPFPPFKVKEELEVKIKPSNMELADKESLKIVGFSEERWKDAVNLKEALDRLDRFAEGGAMVGFNVTLDWGILDKAYYSLSRQDPFHFRRLDVMSMAYMVLFGETDVKRLGLGELCQFFGIKREGKHQALDDAKATYLVFTKLYEYTEKRKKQ